MKPDEYDGFYFTPHEEEGDLNITFFDLKGDLGNSAPVDNSKLGDCWHIAFFRRDKNGIPHFDETFEAIFTDPEVYIKNLVGANLYGCVVRKTEKSTKWFEEYLENAKESVDRLKLAVMAESIANTK